MAKITINSHPLLYPLPAVMIGANVAGQPNFITVGWAGVVCTEPPMVSVSIRPERYSHRGVEQNQTFSINVPSVDQVGETDFCGITSGRKINKAEVCGFKVFYGGLKTAPMIEQCPVNLECRVVHSLKLGTHTLFIGQIEQTYILDSCLTDGSPDSRKIKPMIFDFDLGQYLAFGEAVGDVHTSGMALKKPKLARDEG